MTIWGSSGWASCEQRLAFLRKTLLRARDAGRTPISWQFTHDGYGQLTCCLPINVLERRLIIRQDPGDNDQRLLGLPFFIEPGDHHPFELITKPGWDDEAWVRIHHWSQDRSHPGARAVREYLERAP